MRAALFALMTVIGLSLAGCGDTPDTSKPETKTPETTAKTVANKECPVMGGDVDPKIPTAEWDGKTIGFCCEAGKCKEKFLAMSDDEKKTALEGKLK